MEHYLVFTTLIELQAPDAIVCSHLLKSRGDLLGFGRGALQTRRHTRFLFYCVFIELLRQGLLRAGKTQDVRNISDAVLRVLDPMNDRVGDLLIEASINVIDNYLTPDLEESVFTEPEFKTRFN